MFFSIHNYVVVVVIVVVVVVVVVGGGGGGGGVVVVVLLLLLLCNICMLTSSSQLQNLEHVWQRCCSNSRGVETKSLYLCGFRVPHWKVRLHKEDTIGL